MNAQFSPTRQTRPEIPPLFLLCSAREILIERRDTHLDSLVARLTEELDQVARYAGRIGRDRGYLVIFDRTSQAPWEERGQVETRMVGGVSVVVVRA